MAFRNLEIIAPLDKKEDVTEVFEKEELDYFTNTSENKVFFNVNLPKEKVEDINEELKNLGVPEEGSISVISTEAVISKKAEKIEEQTKEEKEERISREEIVSQSEEMASLSTNYLILTIVSSVIATSGILANSTAVVVGSMVIAPLIGPAVASSVATVLADTELFKKSYFLMIIGLLTSILASASFAWLVFKLNLIPPPHEPTLIPEISERIYPNFLSIGIALGSGIAGALSLTTGISTALVGVMIAVALIPPASVAGVGIAINDPRIAVGASVLLLVNVVSVNLAGTLTLNYQGYSPSSYFKELESNKKVLKRVGMYAGFLLILSIFLGAVTINSYSSAKFQENVREISDQKIENYEELRLKSIDIQYENYFFILESPERVIISIYAEEPPPTDLANQINNQLKQETNFDGDLLIEINQIQN